MATKITPKDYLTAEKNGLSRQNVDSRLKLGWSVERAITEPIRKRKRVVYYLREEG